MFSATSAIRPLVFVSFSLLCNVLNFVPSATQHLSHQRGAYKSSVEIDSRGQVRQSGPDARLNQTGARVPTGDMSSVEYDILRNKAKTSLVFMSGWDRRRQPRRRKAAVQRKLLTTRTGEGIHPAEKGSLIEETVSLMGWRRRRRRRRNVPGARGAKGPNGGGGNRGPRGARGPTGRAGARGGNGNAIPGDNGADGAEGNLGKEGKRGKRGLTGIAGEKGEQGVQGEKGKDGKAAGKMISINCKWEDAWANWEPCSVTCGPDGTKRRDRGIKTYAQGDGKDCEGESFEEKACSEIPCPTPAPPTTTAAAGIFR